MTYITVLRVTHTTDDVDVALDESLAFHELVGRHAPWMETSRWLQTDAGEVVEYEPAPPTDKL